MSPKFRDPRRAVRQRLEDLRRAGVTHIPRTRAAADGDDSPAAAPRISPAAPVSPPATPAPAVADPVAEKPVPALPVEESSAPASLLEPSDNRPVDAPLSSTPSLEERQQQLAAWAARVAACRRCEELADSRTQTVFGVGNPEADILFIGEAPGADEDRQGEPFVGRAGQLLNKIIEACRLTRDEIYICNILRCRPPGNRNPTPREAANCREFLDGQISVVDPTYIVCWGSVAAQNLLDRTDSIGRLRKQFFTYGRAKVLCTYHPSYLLRNPAAKKEVWDDMKFLFRDMGINLDSK